MADTSEAQPVEATPSASTVAEHPAQADVEAPQEQAAPDPFESARGALDLLDEERLARLAKEHPRLKSVVGGETRTLLKQMEGRIEAERRQRVEQELDYILADENHPRHYEELEKHGTARKDVATERVGIRAAIERPEVRSAARVEVGQYIVSGLMASGAFPDVSADDWAEALQAPDFVEALATVKAKQHAADKAAWLKDYEPAIRAKTLDDYRAGLPNPDAGRSVTLPRSGPLTAAQVAAMTPEEYRANKERLRAQLAS